MLTEELRKYLDMCKTEDIIHEQTDNMLHEMANIHSKIHGVPDVVIWVGRANKQHGLRVKVSNVKNKYDQNNNFVIQMPGLRYDPEQVAPWISTTTMNQILTWIKLNQQLLYDYENGSVDDTSEFLSKISKV